MFFVGKKVDWVFCFVEMMRIKKPRNFSWTNIIFISFLGVVSGLYIYQPLLSKYAKEQRELLNKEKEESTVK